MQFVLSISANANATVLKVIRERYIRDDIGSGSLSDSLNPGANPVLSKTGITNNSHFKFPHYLLPDTNILLSQIDLLENESFKDVIILQTVLDEIRHKSLPLYSRLKSMINDEDRRFYVFYNEFSSSTFTYPLNDETPNDRNDRSIRHSANWYNEHLKQSNGDLKVILISHDANNVKLAKEDGIICSDVTTYVSGMPNSHQLLDLIAVPSQDQQISTKKSILYPHYLPTSSLTAGIKSGDLHQGYFNADPYNYLEGSVKVPAYLKPVLLIGRESMNRSVQGDVVVVQILPKSEWKASADEVIDPDNALRNDDAEQSETLDDQSNVNESNIIRKETNEAENTKMSHSIETQPTGKVVGIVKRQWRSYVCHIDKSSVGSLNTLSQQTVFASPLDRKIPKIRIRTRQSSNLIDQKIVVAIDTWDQSSRYPDGHFVRALGKVQSKEAEIESLLLEYDVPYRTFSKSILKCLPSEGEAWTVPPKDSTNPAWKDRVDLRDEIICSIDPPGCTDIDDALHAKPLPNGNIEAGVHIADVSYFVHADTAMDAEAASRGTTVYLVDKRIDMLPSLLGTNLCSLRPHVERLAFSVIWELTPNADIVNVKFHKSVIASKSAFTYEDAQIRKDDKSKNDPLTVAIRLLNDIAIKLKSKRIEAGALNLASPEVKIHLDSSESSEPIDVEQKEIRETNSLVEEFMLLANCSVAAKIFETFPATAVLRYVYFIK